MELAIQINPAMGMEIQIKDNLNICILYFGFFLSYM
jgi:hypothetical protein